MSDKSALHGKAFEHAVIQHLEKCLSLYQQTRIEETPASAMAARAFETLASDHRREIEQAAGAGVSMLVQREPRLHESQSANCPLVLYLQTDRKGQEGDVRDIVIARPEEDWQIGISAKHNHKAVKSSRLAKQLDFGKSWLGAPCSETYKTGVKELFEPIGTLAGKVRWRELGDHGIDKYQLYKRVLEAFAGELTRIYAELGSDVPGRLVRYLIGNHDFYKLMKIRDRTQLQAFNLGGTLGQKSKSRKATPEPQQLKLPKKIYDVHFSDENSNTTVIVACDQGWQLSFRIHNASEFVEPSLKFDITLIGHPAELATHEISWKAAV